MELNKDRGPISSRYDRNRPNDYSPVKDFASHGQPDAEMAFLTAHKITPTEADPEDMRRGGGQGYQEGVSPLPAFLQSLSNSMAQRTPDQGASVQNDERQQKPWSYQNRNARKNQAQSKAAMVGVIIWVVFILASLLMNILKR